ncbi:unnamed protein product [Mytilus coruscus]|uniref:Uncharacterized protein n=1 Tax=Mytilus coruscus TaxID=42192 RepID=A0A6J8A3P0_MYTCO|nr:unnamed protein product [Mytilus coruscus]
MFVPFSRSKTCNIRTPSNETKDVCCADYEKRGKDCIVCSKGYTSDTGQNCKPCSKNTYGERCKYECSCLDFEVGAIKKVCCADFEEKGNDCNACLKGFTSNMGQKCRPCSNHSYGEKCGFDCSCTDNEMYATRLTFIIYILSYYVQILGKQIQNKQHISDGDLHKCLAGLFIEYYHTHSIYTGKTWTAV